MRISGIPRWLGFFCAASFLASDFCFAEPVPEALRQAAKNGDAVAQYQLVFLLQNGSPADRKESIDWLRRSAEGGYAPAEYFLGDKYWNGQGIERDYAKAAEMFQKSAEQGYPAAEKSLGEMYSLGHGVPLDYSKSTYWIQKAYDQGYLEAREDLAGLYGRGQGISKDLSKALRIGGNVEKLRAPIAGYWEVYHFPGHSYPFGHARSAWDWFEEGAKQGDTLSILYLRVLKAAKAPPYSKFVAQVSPASMSGFSNNPPDIWPIQQAALKGDVLAQAMLGEIYLSGFLLPQNYEVAKHWLTLAAEQGDALSQYWLGTIYASGLGMPPDFSEAAHWFERSAEGGDAEAQAALGIAYGGGSFVEQDDEKARYWLEKAAGQNVRDAEAGLGFLLKYRLHQSTAAQRWLEKAAEDGDVGSEYDIGQAYLTGIDAKQDYAKALQWLRKAANAGMPEAESDMSTMNLSGMGTAKDAWQGFFWISKSAAQGLPEAKAQMAMQYWSGLGTERDEPRGKALLAEVSRIGYGLAEQYLANIRQADEQRLAALEPKLKQAKSGSAQAQREVAFAYRTGSGAPQDFGECFRWARKAAEQGDALAQTLLSSLYENGRGTPQDYGQALAWLKKSAAQGEVHAELNLGHMAEKGLGMPASPQESSKWYLLAAEQGNGMAQSKLGKMYREGVGVKKDPVESFKWYGLASLGNYCYSELNWGLFVEQAGRMKPEEIGEAVAWYRKRAEAGDASSQTALAFIYYSGQIPGYQKNLVEARKWMDSAAVKGSTDARIGLGEMFQLGHGEPQDFKRAYHWYYLASLDDDAPLKTANAKDRMSKIEAKLSAGDIDAAKKPTL